MNTRKIILSFVALVFCGHSAPIISMHSRLISHTAIALLSGGTIYGLGKGLAKYEEHTAENVSPLVERWARDELASRGVRNSVHVPLKKGRGWSLAGGSIIKLDSDELPQLERALKYKELGWANKREEDIIALNSASLAHEGGHYNNSHFGRSAFLSGFMISAVIMEPRRIMSFLPQSVKMLVPRMPMVFGVGIIGVRLIGVSIVSCALSRYQEVDADRFACKTAKTRKELELSYDDWMSGAARFEIMIRLCPELYGSNCVTKKIFSAISKKILAVDNLISQAAHNDHSLKGLRKKNERLIRLAFFLSDIQHPYRSDRAAIVQEYLKEWNIKHTE